VPERIIATSSDEFPDTPQLLPDGKTVLFSMAKSTGLDRWEKATVVAQSLTTGVRTTLVEGAASARYVSTGHLLFARAGVVLGVPFDLAHLKLVGQPSPVIEGVRRSISAGSGVAHFNVSDTGTLVYVPGPARLARGRSLFFVDSKGSSTPVPIPIGPYRYPRVTTDGKRLALQVDDGSDSNVSIYDLATTTSSPRRLTYGGHNRFPIWSGDGQSLAFQSDRDGDPSIYRQLVEGGGGVATRLTTADPGFSHIPESWSPDGQTLLYTSHKEGGVYSLWSLSLATMSAQPVAKVQSAEPIGATFSPDGKWIAYSMNERAGGTPSPNRGVYVQPFPPTGDVFQVPKDRIDFHPAWTGNGDLMYVPTVGQFSIVTFQTKPSVTFGRAVHLPMAVRHDRVSTDVRDYDLLRDGRLLITLPGDDQSSPVDVSSQMRVVLNWFEELKQRLPVK
jgi:Tol biopolymer transport system component